VQDATSCHDGYYVQWSIPWWSVIAIEISASIFYLRRTWVPGAIV
jgi:hypothetical protein